MGDDDPGRRPFLGRVPRVGGRGDSVGWMPDRLLNLMLEFPQLSVRVVEGRPECVPDHGLALLAFQKRGRSPFATHSPGQAVLFRSVPEPRVGRIGVAPVRRSMQGRPVRSLLG